MKITGIETIRSEDFPNMLWLHVHTDEGVVGLGETNYGAESVEGFLHENAAMYLLGRDPLQIDRHTKHLTMHYNGYNGIGAEMRGASAVDVALWDILGQITRQPIYQLLGGASRPSIRAYNTCAGYRYAKNRPVRRVDNWGLPEGGGVGPYEDLDAFLNRADELAQSLVEEGYSGMKIWPFDRFAWESDGTHISLTDLKRGLEPFEKIRKAVGDRIEIMAEFHSLWMLPAATTIARHLEPLNPYWLEDPMRMDDLGALAVLARSTRTPITASETLATRWSFRDLLERRAASIVMYDVGWMGGISEAKKVSTMAEAYQVPVAPHDCTGPVVWIASCHLSVNVPNAVYQECVRAFFTTWYREVVTELPVVSNGQITCPSGPGIGTRLQPDFLRRQTTRRRMSKAS